MLLRTLHGCEVVWGSCYLGSSVCGVLGSLIPTKTSRLVVQFRCKGLLVVMIFDHVWWTNFGKVCYVGFVLLSLYLSVVGCLGC